MKTSKELREEIGQLFDQADAILNLAKEEDRDLTEADQAEVDSIMAKIGEEKGDDGKPTGLWAQVRRVENIERHREILAASRIAEQQQADPAAKNVVIPATARRYSSRELRAFKGDHSGMRAEERAYRFGMLGLHVLSRCLPQFEFPQASEFVRNNVQLTAHGISGTTGGHYTVPDEMSADIIDLKESRGVARQLFGRETMMSDTKSIPRVSTGLTTYAVGENSAGTESNLTLDNVNLVARKWMTIARMSSELSEDSAIDFGDKLAERIAYSQADKEDESAFNGDGTSTYHGILGIRPKLQDIDGAGTDANGLKTQGTGSTWGAIVIGDFDSVIGALPEWSLRGDPVWVMSTTFFYEVCNPLVEASGGVTAMEMRQGETRPRPLFKGFPVVFSQVFPKSTASASVVAVLGDFRTSCTFGDRRGLEISFSDQASVGSQSTWERDQIAVKGVSRYDIVCHELGDSSNAGGIVGLQTG